MHRFKSGIVLKNSVVIAPEENESHSDLLESLGITGNYIGITKSFVRAELVPINGEWWINPAERPELWEFVIDRDIIPDWFDEAGAERAFRTAVEIWWKEHVFVGQNINQLSAGYYRIKDCKIRRLRGDARISCDSSQVVEMRDSSRVSEMWNRSQVGEMCGRSRIGLMHNNSWVIKKSGNSQVGEHVN